MRKLFISVISVILGCCMLFGGCSCTSMPTLSFTEGFLGNDKTTIKETLIYSVKNEDNFGTEFKKDSAITDALIKYDYQGTFELTWESIKTIPYPEDLKNPKPEELSGLLGNVISSNVMDVYATNYYKLTSKLELTASYPTINGKVNQEKPVVTDVIQTETYFANRIDSFAPIYTETVANYTNIIIVGDSAGVTFSNYSAYTEYSKKSYTIHTKVGKETTFTSNKYDYSYKTVIDNAQLLFLIRNLDFSRSNTLSLPTVSYQYGEAVNLTIKSRSGSQVEYLNPAHADFDTNSTDVLKYNGALMTAEADQVLYKVPAQRIGFLVDSTTAAGVEQTVFVQSKVAGDLSHTALPLQYVCPLTTLNTYQSLGVLSYKLMEIRTSK